MKPLPTACLTLLLSAACALTSAQTPAPPLRDLSADTWAGTDALGRSLPMAGQARLPQTGKFVGIFYFIWHSRADEPSDNTKLLAADPAHPHYGPVPAFHWWGEPAVGYFRDDDPWVARKNLQILGEAGVDVLFLDVTNAATYPGDVSVLFETAEAMRREGFRTPQIGFLTHSSTNAVVTKLYETYYAKGRYENLWFRWQGKPLLLGDRDKTPLDPKIDSFFTRRDSWAWQPGQDKWQWLDKYPQRPGWHDSPSVPEEVPVSVAGHPTDNLGRSYHSTETWGKGTEPPVDAQYRTPLSGEGLQFQQQWDRALKIDPQFVFVTGWNEWIAQRFESGAGGGPGFLGRVLKPGETFFVDNYNEEFSRDIMPMRGGYGDNYFMQLAANIRRYKGVSTQPVSHGFHAPKTWADWAKIGPQYLDPVGDTEHRDHAGWGGRQYKDVSGRNDITSARVACDTDNIYFYVHTEAALTPYTDPNWMQLLIDTDRNPKTGWHGYDFVVNSRVLSPTRTTLKRLRDGKTWTVACRVEGNQLAVTVPRAQLGLIGTQTITFDFHWLDNVPIGQGDLADWWYVGESAPDGRFNYRYVNQH